MKLQPKILALLLPVIAVPLLILGWTAYRHLDAYSERIRLDQMEILLDQASREVRAKLDTVEANSRLFANARQVHKYALTADEADRYTLYQPMLMRLFATYQQAYPDYGEIRILLPDGYEDTRLAPGRANITEEEGESPLFARIKAAPVTYFSTIGVNPDDGQVVLWAATRLMLTDHSVSSILAEPKLRGYLVLTVAWHELQKRVDTNRIGEGGFLVFTDRSGRILFKPGWTHLAAQIKPAHFKPMVAGLHHEAPIMIRDQESAYRVRGRSLHPDLYLFAYMPDKEISQARNHLALLVSLTIVVVILLSSGLVFLFFRSVILGPIRAMHRAFQKVGGGEFNTLLQTQTRDEFGDLGRAFNRMTDQLTQVTVSRDYVDRIIQHLQDALLVLDKDGTIETVNRAAVKMFGCREDDLVGASLTDLFPRDDDWLTDWLGSWVDTTNMERECLIAGQKRLPVLLSSSSIKDESNLTHRIIVIVRDITGIKAAEAERDRLAAQLHQAHKMEAIGTLAGGVAHDLNNILSGLTSYPEMMLMQLPPDNPMCESLEIIKKSGDRAARIVQDLLTLARRSVKVRKAVDLNTVIEDYLDSHEHRQVLKYHPGVSVTRRLDKEGMRVMGSPTQLAKVVTNLVSNAAEAMPEGGSLTIATEKVHLDRDLGGSEGIPAGDYVLLAVSDTGIGISSEDQRRIFEPFFTKKVMGRSGTGLGMAVVWGTVKDHDGFVDVKSVEGQGTSFRIYLPLTQACVEEPVHVPQASYRGEGEKILVVDDVEEQRIIAARMLAKLGYEVATVDCGQAAVDYVQDNSPELIVLDMIMEPGIDGLETYKRISDKRPGQRVVIASGYAETGRVETLQDLSAGVYLKKPYSLKQLGLAVKSSLGKSCPGVGRC